MISQKIARVASYLFHPLLIPTIGILLIFNSGTYLTYMPFEGKRIIFMIVFLGTFIIPISFFPIFKLFKVMKNIEMNEKDDRAIPFIVTISAYFFTYYLLRRLPIPFITYYILFVAFGVLINFIINTKWKISSHMIGIGGLSALAYVLVQRFNAELSLFIIGIIALSGIIAFARLRLQCHSTAQVYVGYLLGFAMISMLAFVK